MRESMPAELLDVLWETKRASSRRAVLAPAAIRHPRPRSFSSSGPTPSSRWPSDPSHTPRRHSSPGPSVSRRGLGLPDPLVCARRRRPGLRAAHLRVPLLYSRHKLDSRAVSAGFLHRSSIAEGRNVCCCQVAAFCCVCSRASRRVSISRKGIVKCDVFGPIYISYVRCRDEHQAVGIAKHYELNLSLF